MGSNPTEGTNEKGNSRMSKKSYFEVYQDKDGEWRYRLKAGNHEIIAASEGYKTKQGAMNGIESLALNAMSAFVNKRIEIWESFNSGE